MHPRVCAVLSLQLGSEAVVLHHSRHPVLDTKVGILRQSLYLDVQVGITSLRVPQYHQLWLNLLLEYLFSFAHFKSNKWY